MKAVRELEESPIYRNTTHLVNDNPTNLDKIISESQHYGSKEVAKIPHPDS